MSKSINQIAVGVLGQTLQGHGATGRIADQALQLIPPIGGDVGGGMQGKALHAGTAGTGQCGRLALAAKAPADAPDLLASPLAKGEALLHRGGHSAGEFGAVVTQGIMPRGHHVIRASVQIPNLPQRPDDAPTDLLDHGGDVGIAGRLACDKARPQSLGRAVHIDACKENGRCFRAVDSVSDGYPKLIAIDKETDHPIVHTFCLGKADRPADQPLDPRAQGDGLACDLLRVFLPNRVLLCLDILLVGPPAVGAILRDAKRLQQRFERHEDGILPSSEYIGSHLARAVIHGVPYPAWIGFAVHVAPHLVELGAEATTYLQRIRTPYLHHDLFGLEVLQHVVIHRVQVRFFFLIR